VASRYQNEGLRIGIEAEVISDVAVEYIILSRNYKDGVD